MASIVTQDSTFLSLPLELRHQVYSYFIHIRAKKIISTSKALKSVTNLTGISQQTRCEVYDLVAAANTFHISAGIFSSFTLRPLSTATKIRTMNNRAKSCFECADDKDIFREYFEERIQDLKDEIKRKEVPSQVKFWKVCVTVLDTHRSIRLITDINFKEKKVSVCRRGTVDDDLHDFNKAFINAMQGFTKEENFNGVTIQDVSRYLEQVTLPDPNGFWTAEEMFEELKEAKDYEQDEDRAVS